MAAGGSTLLALVLAVSVTLGEALCQDRGESSLALTTPLAAAATASSSQLVLGCRDRGSGVRGDSFGEEDSFVIFGTLLKLRGCPKAFFVSVLFFALRKSLFLYGNKRF